MADEVVLCEDLFPLENKILTQISKNYDTVFTKYNSKLNQPTLKTANSCGMWPISVSELDEFSMALSISPSCPESAFVLIPTVDRNIRLIDAWSQTNKKIVNFVSKYKVR